MLLTPEILSLWRGPRVREPSAFAALHGMAAVQQPAVQGGCCLKSGGVSFPKSLIRHCGR